jgi:hypothetical protein
MAMIAAIFTGPLFALAPLLAALWAITGAGRLMARLLDVDRLPPIEGDEQPPPRRGPAWGWSFLLGLALVGTVLQFPLALSQRIAAGWFYGVLALCAVLAMVEIGSRRRPFRMRRLFADNWIADLPVVLRLLLLMYLGIFLWFAAIQPCISFDARSIFALKARMFDDGRSLADDDFHDPDQLNFNANYPLLAPVVEATLFRARGSQDPVGLQLLFAGFVLASASILAAEIRRFDTPTAAAVWATGLVLLPLTLSPIEGGGLSGSVDYALAAFGIGAVVATGRWLSCPTVRGGILAGIFWGAMVLTKQEGQIWLIAAVLSVGATAVMCRMKFSRAMFSSAVGMIVPTAVCVALMLINRRGIPESPYFRTFGQALRWEWLKHLWKRPWFIIQYSLRGIISPRTFGFCWQLVALALVVLRRPRLSAPAIFWRSMAVLVVGAYFVVLTISPLHLEYQLRTALFRLAIHFLPLVLLIGAEQLSAAGWSHELQSIFTPDASEQAFEATFTDRPDLEESIDKPTLSTVPALADENPATVRAA